MSKIFSIAIDGPAGSGKSTISEIVAEKLHIYHLDTGAMYRAFALAALNSDVDPFDDENVEKLLKSSKVEVKFIDDKQRTFLNDEDVSDKIRFPEVSKYASDIAVNRGVRTVLASLQRDISKKQSIIVDGRDIGSFVLPDADYKFYLTANPIIRAQRRLAELQQKGIYSDKTVEEITSEIISRDKTDSSREFAPLKLCDDAVLIDSSDKTIDEVVALVLSTIKKDNVEK